MVATLLSMAIFTPLGKPSANAVRVPEHVVEKVYTTSDNAVVADTVCALEPLVKVDDMVQAAGVFAT